MDAESEPSGWFRYLPVTNREIAYGTYLTSVGWQNASPWETYPPPGHPEVYSFTWSQGRVLREFAVVWIEQGEGEVESRMMRTKLHAGDVLYIPPGEWHRYRPQRRVGWHARWICCNGETLHRLRSLDYLPDEVTVWPGAGNGGLPATFERLSAAVRSPSAANPMMLSGLVLEVIGSLQPRLAAMRTEPLERDDAMGKAMEFLWSNSHRPIKVIDVARAAAVSRRTLERRFSAEKGVSILAVLRDLRIERARGLLRDSRMAVKEIAYLCGFSDVRSFIRLFRSECGESPGKWRENRGARITSDPVMPHRNE